MTAEDLRKARCTALAEHDQHLKAGDHAAAAKSMRHYEYLCRDGQQLVARSTKASLKPTTARTPTTMANDNGLLAKQLEALSATLAQQGRHDLVNMLNGQSTPAQATPRNSPADDDASLAALILAAGLSGFDPALLKARAEGRQAS